jgi:hypothetical protein
MLHLANYSNMKVNCDDFWVFHYAKSNAGEDIAHVDRKIVLGTLYSYTRVIKTNLCKKPI